MEESDYQILEDRGNFSESHGNFQNFNSTESVEESGQISNERNDNILSIIYKEYKIAISNYSEESKEIQILESVLDEGPAFRILKTLLNQIQPNKIVISTSLSIEVQNLIETFTENCPCVVHKIPPRQLNYELCKTRVLSMEFSGPLSHLESQEIVHYVVSVVNVSDQGLVIALGALLFYLTSEYPKTHLHGTLSILKISHINFHDLLWIDEETFKNLQVFESLRHPSFFKWSTDSKSKEGLSLYNLLSKYCTKLGLPYLRMFMTQPINDIDILSCRHEAINFYNNLNNQAIVQALKSYMNQLSTLSVLMNNLSCQKLRGAHWKHIYRNIYYSVLVAELCRDHGQKVRVFREIGETLSEELFALAHHINKVIDFESMEKNENFVIKYGVCDDLDVAKERFSNLRSILNKISPFEFDSVPEFVTTLQLLYMPEIKFVLSIPFWKNKLTDQELQLPNLDYKFNANNVAFYKSERCKELDVILGDPQIDIMEEESKIIKELVRYLAKNVYLVVNLMKKIVELDCIFALAKLSKENHYSQPEMTNDKIILIEKGRHPLVESCTRNDFISNDFHSSPNSSLIKMLYGPNGSGKTIYLKQIGLIVYLSHLGCFVPAERAVIGVVSRIYSRIAVSEHTVLSKTSSYMIDLKNLSGAVNDSTSSSLIILDEFGKTTSEENALPIIVGFVNYFVSQSTLSPHILVSTQYHSVNEFIKISPILSVFNMSFIVNDTSVIFLFKLTPGIPLYCCTLKICRSYDVPANILKVAERVLVALRTGENLEPYSSARLKRSQRYNYFVKRFCEIDMSKPGYISKLKKKIERVCNP